jgi:hypothetical protein
MNHGRSDGATLSTDGRNEKSRYGNVCSIDRLRKRPSSIFVVRLQFKFGKYVTGFDGHSSAAIPSESPPGMHETHPNNDGCGSGLDRLR